MPERLDRGDSPGLASARERLDRQAFAFLLPYLEHAGATPSDVDAIAASGRWPPFLDGLRRAEQTLGPALLRTIVDRLGWPRLSLGFSAEACEGIAVDGSFPFVVSPAEARILSSCGDAESAWRRHLVVAHGADVEAGEPPAPDDAVARFRAYNVAHAELLDLILAVAPLDPPKVRRILALLERVVADFAALFAATSEDARRVGAVHTALRAAVEADLARDGERLGGDTVRRVQAFEDPPRLDDVTTLHGLKRYLHQQGLRLAFRLFRSHAGANRTVDLLVTSDREVLRCEQVVKYLELEPSPPIGTARLPLAVALCATSLGRQLLHGRKLPWVTLLGFGNELQVYVHFRNHPAFLRIDLSPPFRGGMIDLEYFGVSQYELDQHPDLSLDGIQRVLRQLDFDVEREGLRLHARYDKERAVDLGDVVSKARATFHLLPYLMDVDWIVGDLDYPPPVRAAVAAAWASFFARWGVLPAPEGLDSTRRRVLLGVEPDPAGPRERTWDGAGPFRDRFTGTPRATFGEALRREIDRRGLGAIVGAVPARTAPWGQWALDEYLLAPLHDAAERGEIRETASGIERVAEDLFRREHGAVRLATVLCEGGPALARAVELAELARSVERQARFRTIGSVQGHAVDGALLPTAPRPVALLVLRDAGGIIRLAVASASGVPCRVRSEPGAPWETRDDLDAPQLSRILRGSNYLGAEPLAPFAPSASEMEALRSRFAAPCGDPVPRTDEDDRVVPAIAAAPGWAAGLARFSAGTPPADVDGAVLVAEAVRPDAAPALRTAAAIVSTGGGILSHVGLIALELEKPAVIVEGRWSVSSSGSPILLYRRPHWREEACSVGRYQVVSRHDLHDTDEILEAGDLVAVDADAGTLTVLGHDAIALSLHQDLRQLELASEALTSTRSDADVLASRGRLIRAVHQLDRLLGRIDRPALVRHAVRELLTARATSAAEGRRARTQLLATLLGNRVCGAEARRVADERVRLLQARFEAARDAAVAQLPRLASPLEVLFLRLSVRRVHDLLAGARALVRPGGTDAARAEEVVPLDRACRERLEQLVRELSARIDGCAARPRERWALRHLLPRLAQARQATSRRPAADAAFVAGSALARADSARVRELEPCCVLGADAGGVELRPLVGGKAAHLGEIARVLGPAAVPSWFVVCDSAFRQALALPPPPGADALRPGPAIDLRHAIAQVTERHDWSTRRQANAIRALWEGMTLPSALAEEIAEAYRGLAAVVGDPLVAIRSSAHEEDGEDRAWAGQFDTFLFVRGVDAVLEHLKRAWAGFWTERALEQRRALGLPSEPRGGGVVVQRMVEPRASGVLHTVSAATVQLGEMVINAGLGVGEGIVSGTVDVDHVVVAKEGDVDAGELRVRYRVGDKREQLVHDVERGAGTKRVETRYHQRFRPALEYVELRELVRSAAALERAFLVPLDLEFAVDARGVWILQARPVPVFEAAWRETLSLHPLSGDDPAAGPKEPP